MKELEVQESDIAVAINAYDKKQPLAPSKDLVLEFFSKSDRNQGVGLLVCAIVKDPDYYVHSCYWYLSELIDEVQTDEPLILLQQLAMKFGVTLRIGDYLNKFIFKETIPLKVGGENRILQIQEKNKSGIGTQFFKVEKIGEGMVARCALAFVLDKDMYLKWIKGETVDQISVQIAPQMRGMITYYDLIQAQGGLPFTMKDSEIGSGRSGILFRVQHPDYHLESGFTESSFYISRGSDRLEYHFEVDSSLKTHFYFIRWSPTELQLVRAEITENDGKQLPPEKLPQIGQRTLTKITNAVIPPNSLLEWARKQSIAPTTTCESESDFYQTVIVALQSISDKVKSINMPNPFWDISYQSNRILSRQPKKETDIHPTIHGLLFDIAVSKNLQIAREYPIAGGLLDFLISGTTKTGKVVSACVEFKHAHSADIDNGLTSQLPAYMRSKGSDFGVYCVMFFKGPHFDKPRQFDHSDLGMHLASLAKSHGLRNIRTLIFDFSHPEPPSKM